MASREDSTKTVQTRQTGLNLAKVLGNISISDAKVEGVEKLSTADLIGLQNQLVVLLGSVKGQLTTVAQSQIDPLKAELARATQEIKEVEERIKKSRDGQRYYELQEKIASLNDQVAKLEAWIRPQAQRRTGNGGRRGTLPRAEIAKRLLAGQTPSQIAQELGVSVSGVNNIQKRWTIEGSTDGKPHYVERTKAELEAIAAGQ